MFNVRSWIAVLFLSVSASSAALSASAAEVSSPSPSTSPSSADASPAISQDSAAADAKLIIDLAVKISDMIEPQELEEAFGSGRVDLDMGAAMYRDVAWSFPLASIDVSLELHAGFNYGELADWSMVMDFADRADIERRYYIALCRGMAHVSGASSPATRLDDGRTAPSVSAFYPLSSDVGLGMIRVSSTDDERRGRITVTPASAADAAIVTVEAADRSQLYRWPDPSADIVRQIAKGHRMLSLSARDTGAGTWRRVQDSDGEVGWMPAQMLSVIGVSDISSAFQRSK